MEFICFLIALVSPTDDFFQLPPRLVLDPPKVEIIEPPLLEEEEAIIDVAPLENEIIVKPEIVKTKVKGGPKTATYEGSVYTPSNFVPCGDPRCGMCNEIISQWNTSTQEVSEEVWPELKEGERFETRYREVTKNVVEEYFVDEPRCNGLRGIFQRCWTERVRKTRTVKKTVREPYRVKVSSEVKTSSKPKSLISTPQSVIEEVFEIIALDDNSVVIDAGCGDGRFVIEAARRGHRAIGIEINGDTVKIANERIRRLRSRAIVFKQDALAFDYSTADVVFMYQFPDLMSRILKRIPRGVRIVSYLHPIPGVKNTRHVVKVNGVDRVIFTAITQ